eukprot:Skav235365  [mRNA]  locus=scaffold3967:81793:82236:+ [translate_table: standard]
MVQTHLTPEEWCKTVGMITDEAGDAVNAIHMVVSERNPHHFIHFTLPLVETKKIAEYMLHIRAKNMGNRPDQGADPGGDAAQQILKANARADAAYSTAGFKFEASRAARCGSKQHPGSEWQRWQKVHKHQRQKSKNIEKQWRCSRVF